MKSPDDSAVHLSRRALLGGVAGLAAGRTLPRAAAAVPTLSVMTRNLYLGVDLSRLFRADSMDDVRRIAGKMLAEIRSHPFPARADAIAGEVEEARPDVVVLQEAATVRVQEESDFAEDPSSNASTVIVDLLELLTSKLATRGLDYEVATATVTTDVEVPANGEDGQEDVRLIDRTAVLVRREVETGATRSGTFDAVLRYPMRGTSVSVRRGYCLVDATVGNADITVAAAHLESADAYARERQAGELLDHLPTDRPVVLAGDFNSGPGGSTGAYDSLTESFDDAVSALQAGTDAQTCCQASDLRNDESRLSRRVDHVLYRDGVIPTAIEIVGADPNSRMSADVDGEAVRLWPSDHAGVVAKFEVTAETPTTTATATGSPTDDSTTSSVRSVSAAIPLFETVAGIGGVVLGALTWYHRNS